jgi:hypothetical protein
MARPRLLLIKDNSTTKRPISNRFPVPIVVSEEVNLLPSLRIDRDIREIFPLIDKREVRSD